MCLSKAYFPYLCLPAVFFIAWDAHLAPLMIYICNPLFRVIFKFFNYLWLSEIPEYKRVNSSKKKKIYVSNCLLFCVV